MSVSFADLAARIDADDSAFRSKLAEDNRLLKGLQRDLHGLGQAGQVGGKQAADGVNLLGMSAGRVADIFAGGLLLKGAGALMEFGKTAFSVGADFQATTNRIIAVSGLVGDEATAALGKVNEKALQLGADLPISAQDAAEGMYALVTAGYSVDEALSASTGVAQLASSQMMEVGKASEIVANTLRGFHLEADQAGKTVDILSQTAASSSVEIADIGETMKYVGPVAGALGQDLSDVAVAIGLVGNAGIKGSQAGTALRMTLERLVAPPKEAAGWMNRLGIEVTDGSARVQKSVKEMDTDIAKWKKTTDSASQQHQLVQAFQAIGASAIYTKKGTVDSAQSMKVLQGILADSTISIEKKDQALAALGLSYSKEGGKMLPLVDIIKQFRTNMAGLTETERAEAAAKIAGVEASASFLALVDASEADFQKMITSIGQAEGATDRFAQNMNKGARFQIEQLKGSIETLAIKGFLMVEPYVSRFIGVLTTGVNWIVANMPVAEAYVKRFGDGLQLIAAFVAPLLASALDWVQRNMELVRNVFLAVGGVLVGAAGVGAIMSVVSALAFLISPLGLVMGAAGLLAVAWTNNWGGIQEKTASVIAFVQGVISTGLAFVRQWWTDHGEQVKATIALLVLVVSTTITNWVERIKLLISTGLAFVRQWWTDHGEQVKAIVSGFIAAIERYISVWIENIKSVVRLFHLAQQGDWRSFGGELRKIWDRTWELLADGVRAGWNLLKTAITTLIDSAKRMFTETNWGAVGQGVIDGIAAGIRSGVDAIERAARNAARAALEAAKGFLGISSPSRVAAEQIGLPYAQGWALGIARNGSLVSQAARATALAAVASSQMTPAAMRLTTTGATTASGFVRSAVGDSDSGALRTAAASGALRAETHLHFHFPNDSASSTLDRRKLVEELADLISQRQRR